MSCACRTPIDTSKPAVEAGDYTLISGISPMGVLTHSPCLALPNGGFDVCRFVEGSSVSAVWRIVVPSGKRVKGGQLIVSYKDIRKSYAPVDSVVTVPFADLVGNTWDKAAEGEAEALAILQWQDDRGLIQETRALGIARILVLSKDYAVLPLDSGVQSFEAEVKCRLQYTSAGRSAYRCERD